MAADAGGEIKIVLGKDDHHAKVTVSDTGCGISEEDLPHIFERFYQSNGKKTGGIGLGLAICKRIVQDASPKGGGFNLVLMVPSIKC